MERKSVGIVTINDLQPNYGNRLQNYATQTVLQGMGFETVTYSFEKNALNLKIRIKYIIQLLFGFHLPGDKNYWGKLFPKIVEFNRFNEEYISTERIHSDKDIKYRNFYVVGSDQVWNATWYGNDEIRRNMYLLTFANPEQKVCIAPSFGNDNLPNEWIPWFKKYLATFPLISVREETGANIVKELTGKDAEVIIDPTMMLDISDWRKIEKNPKMIDCTQPYILTYFLGGFSEKARKDLLEYSEKYNLKIYDLMNMNDSNLYTSGPSEFIYLVEHAKLVMTDSFHACVFSFLFEKPFLVYSRVGKESNMFSRIQTLLSKFKLERKYADGQLDNDILEADYKDSLQVLIYEREKALAFLRKSMNMNVQS